MLRDVEPLCILRYDCCPVGAGMASSYVDDKFGIAQAAQTSEVGQDAEGIVAVNLQPFHIDADQVIKDES